MRCAPALLLALATLTFLARAQTAPTAPTTEPLPCTRITLNLTNTPLREALRQLEAQSGIFFRVNGDDHPITLTAANQPLWDTLRQLFAQTGTHAWIMNESHAVGYTNFAGQISAQGPYLVLAKRITHAVDFRPADPAEQCSLELQLAIDRAAPIAWYTPTAHLDQAVDDAGHSLLPTDAPPPDSRSVPVFRALTYPFIQSITIPLQAPAYNPAGHPRRSLKLISGAFPAARITATQTIESPIPSAGDQTIAGIPLFISGVASGDSNASLNLTFRRPAAMDDTQWNAWRRQLGATRCRLLDAAGHNWAFQIPSQGANNQTVTLRLAFSRQNISNPTTPLPGPAAKFTIEVITATSPTTIPFHFEILPLP